jgi:hypothetical protein
MASYEFLMSDGPAVLSGNNLVVFGLGMAMRPRLPVEDLPNMGRGFASGMAGTTEVPGVWVAGNATDLVAQVGASAAAGALAGADINRMLATADTDAALQRKRATAGSRPSATASR